MKKNIITLALGILVSTGVFAQTSVFENVKGEKVSINSPFKVETVEGELLLSIATGMSNKDYLLYALQKDPTIISRVNDTNPKTLVGFNIRNLDILNIVERNDKSLYERYDWMRRGMLSSFLNNYYDGVYGPETKQAFADFEKAVMTEAPELRLKAGEISKGMSMEEMERIALYILSKSSVSLNSVDNLKNTALHYAVYARSVAVTQKLLENDLFYRKNANNGGGENALFMLLDNPCNIKYVKSRDNEILNMLLNAKVNPMQKNASGYSFATLVLGMQEYEHMRPAVEKVLTPAQKNIVAREMFFLKDWIAKGRSDEIYISPKKAVDQYNLAGCK